MLKSASPERMRDNLASFDFVDNIKGSYAKGQARRQQIVDEALLVFARSGFHSGSLREVAKRVGLSPAGVMHHFADKEELFGEVLRQRDEKVRLAAGDPAEHTLIEQAEKVVAYNQTSRGLTSLYAVVAAEATDAAHPAHDEFARRYRSGASGAASGSSASSRASLRRDSSHAAVASIAGPTSPPSQLLPR